MGTRGLWGFIEGEKEYLTYNHWDSYPSGLGDTVLKYVRETPEDEMRAAVKALTLVDEDDTPTEEQIELLKEWANLSVGEQRLDSWYSLLRETQGDPDATLGCGFMIEGADFAQDSLFCEWAYVVDLDARTFEVYKGFQKEPHEAGRFADRFEHKERRDDGVGQYQPVALVRSYSFDELPESLTALEKELYPDEDEVEA